MSTSNRRKSISLIEGLIQAPDEYSFIQATRVLQRAAICEQHKDQSIAANFIAELKITRSLILEKERFLGVYRS